MRLEPGDHLFRFVAVTPANLGDAGGTWELEQPTQKDPLHGLPFLADSALKGVLAGNLGNLNEEAPERTPRRARLYGSPDRFDRETGEPIWGRPGRLIFGDAELLCFPLLAGGGARVWIFPALAVGRFLSVTPHLADKEVLKGLALLEEEPGLAAVWGPTPGLAEAFEIRPIRGTFARFHKPLRACLENLTQGAVTSHDSWILTAAPIAGRLWRAAREVRTLTEIEPSAKTVRAGTLRRIELIPAGSVFLSWTSLLGRKPVVDLPSCAALGAGEGIGLGTFSLEAVKATLPDPTALASSPSESLDPSGSVNQAPQQPEPLEPLMVRMHRAVGDLAMAGSEEVAAAARSVCRQFGSRVKQNSLAGAIGFSLAKAKAADPEPGVEAQAHRWLLWALLDLGPRAPFATGPWKELAERLATEPFLLEVIDEESTLQRNRWLQRFAELGLRRGDRNGPTKEEE